MKGVEVMIVEFLIGLAIDNADVILEVLIGAAAAAITYKVAPKISSLNVIGILREAITSSKQKTFEKLLGQSIKATIKEKRANAISFEVLCVACKEKSEITLESTGGISDDLTKGSVISFTV